MTNKNIFIKNFSKFFTGAFLAQTIGFAISPVLSRVYSPEDFGVFTIYLQLLAPLLVLSGGSLYLILPRFKDSNSTIATFKIVMFGSFTCSCLVGVLSFFNVGQDLYLPILGPMLAIGVLLSNFRGFFHFQSIADEEFSLNSKAKLSESIVGGTGNIGFGLLGFKHLGLVVGNLIGQIIFVLFFIFNRFDKLRLLIKSNVSFRDYYKKHKKHIVLQSSNHLVEFSFVLAFSILITKTSSISELGFFAFCYKIINTPLNLIADYFGQAALGRIADFPNDLHRKKFLIKSGLLLMVPSLSCVTIFYNWGPEIFEFVFGQDWIQAGIISKAYILAIVSTFFIKALQYFPNIKNKHEVYSIFSVLTFGFPVVVLMYGSLGNLTFIESLEYLSLILFTLASLYFVCLLRMFTSK